VTDPLYVERLGQLFCGAFNRTRGSVPTLNFNDVLNDAASGNSVLLGTFWPQREKPFDLIGFAWVRLHGDYVVYDAAGSERSPDLGRTPISYSLVWEMMRWGRQHGAAWAELGGVIPPDAPSSHPTYGISAFKRRFSDDEREVSREFRIYPETIVARSALALRSIAGRLKTS
jgi:hypothetical protein